MEKAFNKDFGKLDDGKLQYAPRYLVVDGWLISSPLKADYFKAGYLPIKLAAAPSDAPAGKHYEADGWKEVEGEDEAFITNVWKLVDDPPPAPRKWSRLSIKRTLEASQKWTDVKEMLVAADMFDDFLAADFILEDDEAFIAARSAAVEEYGEEAVAHLIDQIPVEE